YNTDNSGAIEVWDYARRERVRRLENAGWESAFSSDGQRLATSGNNEPVRVWDLQSGQVLKTLPARPRQPRLCFAPNAKQLAIVDDDGVIELWDISTGHSLKKFSGHQGQIWQIAFSTDGKLLASAGTDQTVRLWNIETGEAVAVRRGHVSEVWSVQLMPD